VVDPRTSKPVTVVSVYGALADSDPMYKRLAYADWIEWERAGMDPVQNQTNTCPSLNITYSGLAPYLAIKRLDHNTDAEARSIAPTADAIFRCPSDRVEAHFLNGADSSRGSYMYSYAINRLYAMPVSGGGIRFDGKFSGRITSIRNPAEKVLYICQDEKTADDGAFSPNSSLWSDPASTIDMGASRHESRIKKSTSGSSNRGNLKAEGHEDARSNIGFADGHAEFFSRKDALRQKYSGNATPDPAGF
jgi:prepilin-type processing-associated H-X9-DG protein